MIHAVHVLGIAGSLRRQSFNRALLHAAMELTPAGMVLESFDLAAIPLYDGDLEAAGLPDPVRQLRQRIAAADALLLVTPEYNHSVPGVLKNAIDWASRPPDQPCAGKPVALMGASTGGFGTVRAQAHLRQICTALDMRLVNKPDVLVTQVSSKVDAEGRLTDEATRRAVQALLGTLGTWSRQLAAR